MAVEAHNQYLPQLVVFEPQIYTSFSLVANIVTSDVGVELRHGLLSRRIPGCIEFQGMIVGRLMHDWFDISQHYEPADD